MPAKSGKQSYYIFNNLLFAERQNKQCHNEMVNRFRRMETPRPRKGAALKRETVAPYGITMR
jgi:hypothetical protein